MDGKFAEAIAECRKAAAAVASRLDEQLEQSIEAYKAAIHLRPDDERARMGLADVLIDMERFSEATQVLEETIRGAEGTGVREPVHSARRPGSAV